MPPATTTSAAPARLRPTKIDGTYLRFTENVCLSSGRDRQQPGGATDARPGYFVRGAQQPVCLRRSVLGVTASGIRALFIPASRSSPGSLDREVPSRAKPGNKPTLIYRLQLFKGHTPSRMLCAASATAFSPDEQTLLTVVHTTSGGRPAPSAACRAGAWTGERAIVSFDCARRPDHIKQRSAAEAKRAQRELKEYLS